MSSEEVEDEGAVGCYRAAWSSKLYRSITWISLHIRGWEVHLRLLHLFLLLTRAGRGPLRKTVFLILSSVEALSVHWLVLA